MTPAWSTACPDWEARLKNRQSIIPPPIFEAEAELALSVFKQLRIPDLPGKPAFGECSEPWVFDFVASVFGAYDTESKRQLIREFFLLIAKKNTKALALDTPIPTPSGWTTMGDLAVGDTVFGADGKPCRVVGESDVFTDHKCYELTFSNGQRVVADAGHLWVTSSLLDHLPRNKGGEAYRVRTTQQIVDTLRRKDGAASHSMLMPEPIECEEKSLPIKPYTLGAWLGDGHTDCARITTMDGEILSAIEGEGYKTRFVANNGSKASTYYIGLPESGTCRRGHLYSEHGTVSANGRTRCLQCERQLDKQKRTGEEPDAIVCRNFQELLRKAGVLGRKHIPEEYLRGSKEQRIRLLQGLLDTDGGINSKGDNIVFSSSSRQLAEGVGALLSTLGIKFSLTERKTSIRGKFSGTSFYVQFNCFVDDVQAFTLPRKLNRMRRRSDLKVSVPRSRRVQIVDAVEIKPVPVKCIAVDSPDHQFLFGETMLPTHNSTLCAGIMLTALIIGEREEEEHLILAPSKEVADNAFKPAAGMVRCDDELSELMHVQDHIRTITHRVSKASLKVVAADTDAVSGKKAGRIMIDELWVFGSKASAESMFMEATGGQVSRDDGWIIWLTTQSDKPPAGVFKDKLQYFRDVRDGIIDDPKALPVIYEYPQEMVESKAYLDPSNFYIANPNIGRSVSSEWISDQLKRYEGKTDGSFQQFIAKHLNIEIGLNLRSDRWAGADYWEDAAIPCELHDLLERSEVVDIGIDGGGLDDLLGIYLIGREKDTQRKLGWGYAWAHPSVLERRKEIAPALQDFANDGHLTLVKRVGEDVDELADIAEQVHESGLLDKIGCDPAGIGTILDKLEERDIPKDKLVAVSQGWKLGGAIKTAERWLADGSFAPADQPMMAWCVGNAKVEPRANSILITKQASGSAKIDPLMAMFNAVTLMALNPDAATKKYQMFVLG